MKVVITGATGFLGSWVCRILQDNHTVTALIRQESNIKRLAGIKGLRIIKAPVENWHRQITSLDPDAYISMDWWGVEGRDRNDSRQSSNVHRTWKLLDKLGPIPIIVGTGSQAELGPVSELISEKQHDAPTTEYGRAKIKTRNLFEDYATKSNSRFAWARIFSTYGPLASNDWLIPSTMRTLTTGAKMSLTHGEQEWSYLHVYDLAQAIRRIIEVPELSGVINVGNPETVRISDVTKQIADLVGSPELLEFGTIPYREDQVMRLAPICESLTKAGWLPMVSLKDGLENLYRWLVEKKNSPLLLKDATKQEFNLPLTI
jgi:nucleoside-diphosphate-sugar epimerase